VQGFVEAKTIPQEGKPNRREYHITCAGRAELHQWVTAPLPLSSTREAWLIQVFFSQGSTNEEVVSLFKAREVSILASLNALRNDTQSPNARQVSPAVPERYRRLWQMTFDYGSAYYEAELQWIQKAIEQARQLPQL